MYKIGENTGKRSEKEIVNSGGRTSSDGKMERTEKDAKKLADSI